MEYTRSMMDRWDEYAIKKTFEEQITAERQECKIAQNQARKDGYLEGRNKGISEGKLEGLIAGKVEGKIDGLIEAKANLVKTLHDRDRFPLPEIAELVGVTEDFVKEALADFVKP